MLFEDALRNSGLFREALNNIINIDVIKNTFYQKCERITANATAMKTNFDTLNRKMRGFKQPTVKAYTIDENIDLITLTKSDIGNTYIFSAGSLNTVYSLENVGNDKELNKDLDIEAMIFIDLAADDKKYFEEVKKKTVFDKKKNLDDVLIYYQKEAARIKEIELSSEKSAMMKNDFMEMMQILVDTLWYESSICLKITKNMVRFNHFLKDEMNALNGSDHEIKLKRYYARISELVYHIHMVYLVGLEKSIKLTNEIIVDVRKSYF